jgi:CYTH domain-containing protein
VAVEIERKYRVVGDEWRHAAVGSAFRQGYLSTVKERIVRVRVIGEQGFLTVKGITVAATRTEFEYEIPVADAALMLDELCQQPIIEKTRYRIDHGGLSWEIDEFGGANRGLVVVEVELEDANQEIDLPDWVGEDVTDDPRYFNSNLIAHPYTTW